MDPLSDVLSLLKTLTYSAGGLDTGGDWAIQFSRYEGIKCYAVASGDCWLSVEGMADPVRLKTGDCYLLTGGQPFRLASDLSLSPVSSKEIFLAYPNGGSPQVNGGGDCLIIGGHFSFAGSHANILLGFLPSIVHLHTESDKAELRWSIERMRQELSQPRPGHLLVLRHLAHMMLVQALRVHLAKEFADRAGWLFALADKRMSAAISAIHNDPAYPWTLQKLAERSGMSRSSFALSFRRKVGASPMEYLTRWRMLLAGDKLQDCDDSISVIAQTVGYESESAFGKAFKRVMGCSPRQYGRNPRATLPREDPS